MPPTTTGSDGETCASRKSSTQPMVSNRIPLSFTELSTSTAVNNIATGGFPSGNYITGDATYGLPSDGGVGITIDGVMIFPIYDARGGMGQEKCGSGECSEHVGEGGGQPHIHGDPFGDNCMYTVKNYTNQSILSHPPLIGWSRDGGSIYGRYLSESAPGFDVALDSCGGHSHGSYGYHYHT